MTSSESLRPLEDLKERLKFSHPDPWVKVAEDAIRLAEIFMELAIHNRILDDEFICEMNVKGIFSHTEIEVAARKEANEEASRLFKGEK